MPKGNRTDSPRDAGTITALNERYTRELDEYKRFAQARRERRTHTQEQMPARIAKANAYFAECDAKRQPYTIAGLLLALEIDRNTWSRMGKGEFDFLVEEILDGAVPITCALCAHAQDDACALDFTCARDNISRTRDSNACANFEFADTALIAYSDLHEKCTLRVQEQRETACSSLRGNPAGNIFLLKAQNGLREDDSTSHVTNNNLVICDAEQARKALALLG